MRTSVIIVNTGSSPLTRGKPGSGRPAAPLNRLIPAHAGKTVKSENSAGDSAAHPRSRGENQPSTLYLHSKDGSSPLTRGKLRIFEQLRFPTRLIPAHAGKTQRRRRPATGRTAHPRSRGENAASNTRCAFFAGSSPLTRGKRHIDRTRDARPRLIPAHAGKTAGRSRRSAG